VLHSHLFRIERPYDETTGNARAQPNLASLTGTPRTSGSYKFERLVWAGKTHSNFPSPDIRRGADSGYANDRNVRFRLTTPCRRQAK
jgi:hypothetical protein